MDTRPWILAIALIGCDACTWVDGACWLRSDDGAGTGTGGAVITSGGTGNGDAPSSEPQAAGDPPPPPECLQVPQGPCYQKCLADYESAAAACGKIANDAERSACQDAAYAAYNACRGRCKQQEDDHKDKCVEMYDTCMDKGDPCTKQVEHKKTLCAFCLSNCIAKEPYKYSECYQCGFE